MFEMSCPEYLSLIAYTLPSCSKSYPHIQNLSKSTQCQLFFPVPKKTKLGQCYIENEMIEMKKAQQLTKAIKNRRISSSIKVCSPFELYRKLKYCASESPTFS